MVMGEQTESADVVVIGAGPGGYVAAIRAAQLGKDVIVIEKERVGGICLQHGCIPSKALIHATTLYHEMQHAEAMGITVEKATLDGKKLIAWKQGITDQLTAGIEGLFKKHNIRLIQGEAFFQNSNRVGVKLENKVIGVEYQKCILATGAKPYAVKGLETDGKQVIGYREALALEKTPKHIVIVGAGYIAVEMANVYVKRGSKVTMLVRSDVMLRHNDQDAVKLVKKTLEEQGVQIYFNTQIEKLEKRKTVTLTLKGDHKETVDADVVLVSTGVQPLLDGLELHNTSLKVNEKGFVEVNKQLQTTDDSIYAIGDITGEPMLAHKASAQGKIAAEAIAGKKVAFDNRVVPAVVYSDPEIASVGMTKEEAEKIYGKIIESKFPFAALGKALTMNDTRGFVKIFAEKKTEVIVGASLCGPHVAELVAELALAIEMSATLHDVAATIHTHPTLMEAVQESAEDGLGNAIHIFKKK